jgi:hypothetical protein
VQFCNILSRYEAIDFDYLDAGASSLRCRRGAVLRFFGCKSDSHAVYVQKAVRASVTPVKSLGSSAAISPATPATALKAARVKSEDGRPALEALLKEMGIGLERLRAASRGKSDGKNGLNMGDVQIVLHHFNVETDGCKRADLDSKLSHLLSSLGV